MLPPAEDQNAVKQLLLGGRPAKGSEGERDLKEVVAAQVPPVRTGMGAGIRTGRTEEEERVREVAARRGRDA